MKILPCCFFGFALAISTISYGQIDIFQSDAYSVEEMCAREAEQNPVDYTEAYDACIDKNRDNPMYQTAQVDAIAQDTEESVWDDSEQSESSDQDEGYQDYSQGQDEGYQDYSEGQARY